MAMLHDLSSTAYKMDLMDLLILYYLEPRQDQIIVPS